MIRYLSHVSTESIPGYGNADNKMEIRPIKAVENGDSCRTFWFGMENHWGTHLDCPAHFFLHGKRVTDYDPAYWLFDQVQVLTVQAEPGKMIGVKDLHSVSSEAELLLIQTGWTAYRGQEIYSKENPGIHPDAGIWLRKNFPNLRAVGMDFVSVSSFANRDLGRAAHRAFLDPDAEGHPLLLIEDMNLAENLSGLHRVWLSPILIAQLDSAPCTVIGFFN